MDACITGWGHTPFGRLDGQSIEDMIVTAAGEALEQSGLQPGDIDAIYVGNFNAGLVPDAFISSLPLMLSDDLRFTPATRLENACASGAAAIWAARNAIRCGDARKVLVIGAEKMTSQDTAGVTRCLSGAGYQKEEADWSFPQQFGRFAAAYFQAYGDNSESLARIAAKNHDNATRNPLAHIQRETSFDFCNTVSDKNPLIADPLRLTDCSLISDGAAALVMVAEDMKDDFDHAIGFRAAVQVNDFLPVSKRDFLKFEGPTRAFTGAFDQAGVTVKDINFAEVHDCFTIAELMIYEAMGLTAPGKGASALADGTVYKGGSLPVNLSGGLKAKGHPVGATGVSMHVMAARQLSGTAGDMQADNAELGCVFNMGGSAVANYCTILERTGGTA